jgi:photosystem II stability/assembly factor-like uncharacterized protein
MSTYKQTIGHRQVTILLLLAMAGTGAAQTVAKQFQQTIYDFKELVMIDTMTGWGVGRAHWDQESKASAGTVMRTDDSGETWTAQNTGTAQDLWDICFTDRLNGWAVGDSGTLIRTSDGGETWTKQPVGTDLNFKSLSFSDESNGWILANEVIHTSWLGEPNGWQARIWHTEDGGNSWNEQLFPDDIGLIHRIYFIDSLKGWAVGIRNDSIAYLVNTYCAAYYTGDGGQTWVEQFSPDLKLVFTDICFTDSSHGWIVGFKSSSGETGGTVFRTRDGGENWDRIPQEETLWEVAFLDTLRGYAIGSMYGAAWGPPVLRTMDGGDTWERIHMEEHDEHGLYGLAVFDHTVLAIGDRGYIASSGDPWGEMGFPHGENLFTQKTINIEYEFEDIFFINSQKGWVCGKKSVGPGDWAQVILRTQDGGSTWTESYSKTTGYAAFQFRLCAIQFVSETKGWATGDSDPFGDEPTTGILFTENGGDTWVPQAHGVSEGEMVDVYFSDERNGWALTSTRTPDGFIQLYQTNDGGLSWEGVNTGQPGMITIGYGIRTGKVYFHDPNTGWILGACGFVLKTTDGGDHWNRVSLPRETTSTMSLAFSDAENGIICGYTNFRTENGGDDWTEEELTDSILTDVIFTDSLNGWMVGEYGMMFRTNDGGHTWNRVEHQATEAAMKSVTFTDIQHGWAAGRGGTILKINNPATSGGGSPVLDSADETYQLSTYPNPFRSATTIEYTLPEPATVQITLHDMQGRILLQFRDGFRLAGTYRRNLSGTGLKDGIYICRLHTEKEVLSRAMLLIR